MGGVEALAGTSKHSIAIFTVPGHQHHDELSPTLLLPRLRRDSNTKKGGLKEETHLLQMLRPLATAEMEWRDETYLRTQRRVAFLVPAWGGGEWRDDEAKWQTAVVRGEQRGVHGWSESAEVGLETTEVIAMVDIQDSPDAPPLWGVAWFNRVERWLRVSWTKGATRCAERTARRLTGRMTSLEEEKGGPSDRRKKWWLRYREPGQETKGSARTHLECI